LAKLSQDRVKRKEIVKKAEGSNNEFVAPDEEG